MKSMKESLKNYFRSLMPKTLSSKIWTGLFILLIIAFFVLMVVNNQ